MRRSMMIDKHISKKQVEHVAWLSRLELFEEEKKLFTKQFNEILEYFNKINELDTEKTPPTYHVVNIANVFRKDEVRPSLSNEQATQNAPKKRERYFEAPKIF